MLALDAPVSTYLQSEVNITLIFVSVSTAASPVVVVVDDICAQLELFAATEAIDNNAYTPTPPLNLADSLVGINQVAAANDATADVVVDTILDLRHSLLLPLLNILCSSVAAIASKPVQ